MEMVLEGKTKTGELDFKLAAAACYLPMMMIHVVAAGVFLVAEPTEHRFVRFHAVQSLLLSVFFIGGSMVLLIGGMMLVPLVVMVLGTVAGGALSAVSEDLGALLVTVCGLVAFVSYVLGALGSVALSLAYLPAFLLNLVLVASGKVGRWPVFGGLAERFV